MLALARTTKDVMAREQEPRTGWSRRSPAPQTSVSHVTTSSMRWTATSVETVSTDAEHGGWKWKTANDSINSSFNNDGALSMNLVPYTSPEVQHLLDGVRKYGKSWKKIRRSYNFHVQRTSVGLKKKYYKLLIRWPPSWLIPMSLTMCSMGLSKDYPPPPTYLSHSMTGLYPSKPANLLQWHTLTSPRPLTVSHILNYCTNLDNMELMDACWIG